jgi:hypothetical protein
MSSLEQHHEAGLVRAVRSQGGGGALLQRRDHARLEALDAFLQASGLTGQRRVFAGGSSAHLLELRLALVDKPLLGRRLAVLSLRRCQRQRDVDHERHEVRSTLPLPVRQLVGPVRLAAEPGDLNFLARHLDVALLGDDQGVRGDELVQRRHDGQTRLGELVGRGARPALQADGGRALLLAHVAGLVLGTADGAGEGEDLAAAAGDAGEAPLAGLQLLVSVHLVERRQRERLAGEVGLDVGQGGLHAGFRGRDSFHHRLASGQGLRCGLAGGALLGRYPFLDDADALHRHVLGAGAELVAARHRQVVDADAEHRVGLLPRGTCHLGGARRPGSRRAGQLRALDRQVDRLVEGKRCGDGPGGRQQGGSQGGCAQDVS